MERFKAIPQDIKMYSIDKLNHFIEKYDGRREKDLA